MVKHLLLHPRVLLESQDLQRKSGSQDLKYLRNQNLQFNSRHLHQEDRVYLSHKRQVNQEEATRAPSPSHRILEEETERVPKDRPAQNSQRLLTCHNQKHQRRRKVHQNLFLQSQCPWLNSLLPKEKRWQRTQPLKSNSSQRRS